MSHGYRPHQYKETKKAMPDQLERVMCQHAYVSLVSPLIPPTKELPPLLLCMVYALLQVCLYCHHVQ